MGRVLPLRLQTDLGAANPPPVIVIASSVAPGQALVRTLAAGKAGA